MAIYDYDESKYIESLELEPIRTKLFQNLQVCLKNMHKVDKFKRNEVENNRNIDIADQINAVPFQNMNGLNEIEDLINESELEFNFELVGNLENSLQYLTQFDKRFCHFIEHLVQITQYMHKKEAFYNDQIINLSQQLIDAENQN